MKSLLTFIRKNRWTLLLAVVGVLLIRWQMQHDGPERLIDVPEGELLAIQNGQMLINQGGANRLELIADLISVDAVTGAKHSLLREQNRLVQIGAPDAVNPSWTFRQDKSWLYYVVMSGLPKAVSRADKRRALQIPPLVLRRVHMQDDRKEDLLHLTCGDAPYQMLFDPKLAVVSTPTLRIVDDAVYWFASLPIKPAAPRLLVEEPPTQSLNRYRQPARRYSLMCKPFAKPLARAVANSVSSVHGQFTVYGDRLYWIDGEPDADQWSKNGREIIRSIGHMSLWTRRLPDGPIRCLASGLHMVSSLTPTSYGLYVEDIAYTEPLTKRLLYFDLDNHCHPITFPMSTDMQSIWFEPVAFRGRIYTPAPIATNISGLKDVKIGCLLSMKPDGSDQKQLLPVANPIVIKMEAPVAYRGRLYVTAEVKKSYYDGLAPLPLLTQLDEAPTEHLQPLPGASEVAGTYFDGNYCYYVKSEERKSWRNWLDDTREIPTQKVLYRYRLPGRRKSY